MIVCIVIYKIIHIHVSLGILLRHFIRSDCKESTIINVTKVDEQTMDKRMYWSYCILMYVQMFIVLHLETFPREA